MGVLRPGDRASFAMIPLTARADCCFRLKNQDVYSMDFPA